MNETAEDNLEQLVKHFFARADSFEATFQKKFCAEYKVDVRRLRKLFPAGKWQELRYQWVLARLRPVLDEIFNSAIVRERFSMPIILKRMRGTGITRSMFLRIAGDEWRDRRMQLPTLREKVLTALNDLVARRIRPEELTYQLIFETARVSIQAEPRLRTAVLAARRELLEYQSRNKPAKPREETVPGDRIRLDADVWHFKSGHRSYLRRNLLRGDIAGIAWTQLRDDLLEKHLAWGSVGHYFNGYRYAGELLGNEVPDVREATLERVQRAWVKYDGKPRRREAACFALRRIFTHLYSLSTEVTGVDGKEMLLISSWLYTSASVRLDGPDESFLSEKEMDAVIACCLLDIKAGLDFTEGDVDLLNLSTRRAARDNAVAVVEWASALMILLMLFTGLRPESVSNLNVGDLTELRPGLFLLVWSHGKKREEKVAVLAAPVALLIKQYIQRTTKLRQALGTENIFLRRSRNSYWSTQPSVAYIGLRLKAFTRRHGIKREEKPLKLNGQILRRTYVTRELYMGRSIWALRLQLGHASISTTRRYGKFDLYEHPGEVGAALDDYGKKSLTLWHRPLLLAELDAAERAHLLGLKEERNQDVGMCRHAGCIKISAGSPPPCSLCEHLVTGPEYLKAWGEEQKGREVELARLRSTPSADQLLAQKSSQYEVFKMNLATVRGRVNR